MPRPSCAVVVAVSGDSKTSKFYVSSQLALNIQTLLLHHNEIEIYRTKGLIISKLDQWSVEAVNFKALSVLKALSVPCGLPHGYRSPVSIGRQIIYI